MEHYTNMKKTFLLALVMSLCFISTRAEYVFVNTRPITQHVNDVDAPYTPYKEPRIMDVLIQRGYDISRIDTLVVSGTLYESDLVAIKQEMTNLTTLNLNGASLEYRTFDLKDCSHLKALVINITQLNRLKSDALNGCNNLTDIFVVGNGSDETYHFNSYYNLELYDVSPKGRLHLLSESMNASRPELLPKDWEFTFDTEGCCGRNATWRYDRENASLTIEGTGDIDYYTTLPLWQGMKSAIIPEGITGIPDAAFSGLGIESLTLPSTLQTIGTSAFSYCSALKGDIVLPNLRFIGDDAFRCTAVESIKVGYGDGVGLTYLGFNAFYECRSLKSFSAKVDNLTVNTSAFITCTELKDVTFDGDVEILYDAFYGLKLEKLGGRFHAIGKEALKGQTMLKEIDLSQCDSIGQDALMNCSSITELDLRNVRYIGANAFNGCGRLSTVQLPPSLDFLGAYAFNSTSWLKANAENQMLIIGGWIYSSPVVQTDYSICASDAIVGICDEAFVGNTNLQQLELGKNVRYVGAKAFGDCVNLQSVIVNKINVEWGEMLFGGCKAVGTLVIREEPMSSQVFTGLISSLRANVQTVHLDYNSNSTFDNMFLACRKLKEVTFPSGLKYVADGTFAECISLPSLILPETVESIGNACFKNCESLSSIKLPVAITELPDETFSGCKALKDFTLPANIKHIGNGCFKNCESLSSIKLPVAITELPDETFSGCKALRNIALPASLETIGYACFRDCESLGSINIPETVTWLSDETFSGCKALGYILLPESVTSIGEKLFNGCSALSKAIIKANLTVLPSYTFQKCASLTELLLPETLTTIEANALQYCSSLEQLALPASVREIGNSVFSNDKKLVSLVCAANEPPAIFTRTFSSFTTGNCVLYVPEGTQQAYIDAGWTKFKSIETIPTAIQIISEDTTEAPVFDLQGRKVTSIQEGIIYIQNGKKVIKR